MPNAKQRREAERRRLQRQAQTRARRSARHRRYALITSITGTLVVIAIVLTFIIAVTNDDSNKSANSAAASSPAPSATTSTTAAAAAKYPCNWQQVSTTPAKQVSPPDTTRPPRTGTVNLLVQTSQGAMTFQLNRAEAPCAVESFISLAQQLYFNNSPCHRLTSGTLNVLQCGDPTGSGSGGPGYEFNDELTGKEKYTRGVIAMANGGANTNGSQFFIVYKNSTLSPNYTIFGRVTSGLKVVDKVAKAGTDNANGQGDGKPKLAIKVTGISVVQ